MIFLDMDETTVHMIRWLKNKFPDVPDIWKDKAFFQSEIYEKEIVDGLFLKLEPRKDMLELINFIVLNRKRHSILSRAGNVRYQIARGDKIRWLERHHPYFDSIEGLHFTKDWEDKPRFARAWVQNESTTPVLIDDDKDICKHWSEAGGVAINFQSTSDTIYRYKELLKDGIIIE